MSRAAKVCLIGDFGVGKTSLVNRFVKQAFSERYQTTVGVTIETVELDAGRDGTLKLIIWDIAGSNVIDTVKKTYLRGATGLIFVADGTRADTLEVATGLRRRAEEILGSIPSVLLFNKSDLSDHWELDPAGVAAPADQQRLFLTSAKPA